MVLLDSLKEQELLKRISQLEEKVAQLRVSRRVLIQLVERIEREKAELLQRAEREKRILKLQNARYARLIFERNRQLALLQNKQSQ